MYQFGQCTGCSKFIFPINFIGNSCLRLDSFILRTAKEVTIATISASKNITSITVLYTFTMTYIKLAISECKILINDKKFENTFSCTRFSGHGVYLQCCK